MRKSVLLLLLICFIVTAGFSQCCSGGVPISSNLGLSSKDAGTLQFQMTYDFNTLRDLFSGSRELDDDSRERNTISVLLEASYDISPAFSTSVLFSWVRQEREIVQFNGEIDKTVNEGIGDPILLFRYNIFHKNPEIKTRWLIGAGPKFPLGRNDFRSSDGILLPADLQPGTGAWDIIFWTNATQYQIVRPTTNLIAILTYRLTTTGRRNNNLQDYKFGNELLAQLGLSDRFNVANFLIDPSLLLRFRHVEKDQLDGRVFPNTGGTDLFLAPSLTFNFSPTLALRTYANFPLHREMIGTQVATSYRLAASLYWSFSTRKKSTVFN